jgi:MFS family permease
MKLNNKRTVLVGLAFLSICAFWQMYDNVVPLILTKTFHLNETFSGAIMAADNILALFLLPFFGTLSDKSNSRFGKRKPFILIGTVLAFAFTLFIPFADNTNNFYLFIAMLGGVLVSMGIYRSPAVALMPDVTPKVLRSSGNAVINLMGALGGVFTLAVTMFLVPKTDRPDYYPLFIAVALFMLVSVLVMTFTVKENKEREAAEEYDRLHPSPIDETKAISESVGKRLPPEVFRSLIFLLLAVAAWYMAYNAVTTAFSSYVSEVWGLEGGGYASCLMVATVAAVLSYIPVGIISSKVGRKKVIYAGVVIMALAYAAGMIANEYGAWVNIVFAAVGIGWAAINVNSYPMVVEMASGGDIGKYTGLYYTFSMAAQILTPIASGALLEHISYRTLFPYATVFMVIAFILMIFVRHGDNKNVSADASAFDISDM